MSVFILLTTQLKQKEITLLYILVPCKCHHFMFLYSLSTSQKMQGWADLTKVSYAFFH